LPLVAAKAPSVPKILDPVIVLVEPSSRIKVAEVLLTSTSVQRELK
jgi:hypothetical protein